MAQLVLRRGGVADRLPDFIAEQLAVTLAKAVDGDFDGAFSDAQLPGELTVGLVQAVAGEARLELVEDGFFAAAAELGAKAAHHQFEDRKGPTAVIDEVSREGIGGFGVVSGFSGVRIEGYELMSASAFPGAFPVPFVGEIMFEGREEKRTELAAGGIDVGEIVFMEEAGEETLDQILGIMG